MCESFTFWLERKGKRKRKNYASSKKLLTSIKEKRPLGKKSPFTRREKGQLGQSLGVPGYHSLYLLVLVLWIHIRKRFFWGSSIHLIVLLALKSEPRWFLLNLLWKLFLSFFSVAGWLGHAQSSFAMIASRWASV